MKYIFILLTFNVVAKELAPKPFQNSTIERRLENGTIQKFDGNQYMIVRRKSLEELALERLAKEKALADSTSLKNQVDELKKEGKKERIVEKPVYNKNSVKGFVGHGPYELKRKSFNEVELKNGNFLGLGYERMLNKELSIEVIGTTNESLMLGAGFHF